MYKINTFDNLNKFLTSILLAIVLLFLLVQIPTPASAQTAEDICPNPGTSQYAACVSETNRLLNACDANSGAGTSGAIACRNQVIQNLQQPSTPGSPTTPGAGAVSGDPLDQATCNPDQGTELNSSNCGIVRIVVIGTNFLAAVAGLAIVASIMIAGYQYMTARDNAGQVQKAKSRIVWAIISLFLFIFMYAFLNFLIPGGVF